MFAHDECMRYNQESLDRRQYFWARSERRSRPSEIDQARDRLPAAHRKILIELDACESRDAKSKSIAAVQSIAKGGEQPWHRGTYLVLVFRHAPVARHCPCSIMEGRAQLDLRNLTGQRQDVQTNFLICVPARPGQCLAAESYYPNHRGRVLFSLSFVV